MQIKNNYSMSNVTTLQIGGPAKKFATVTTEEELIEAINFVKDQQMPFLVIGGGSNLLISDKGVDFLVIKNDIQGITKDNHQISVKSGTPLQELVNFAIENGLSGLQKLSGIPGTVGGAVYGNAGAYGQSISDHLTNVVILARSDSSETRRACPESLVDSGVASLPRMTLSKKQCTFDYRHSIFKKTHDIILEVSFRLEPGDPKVLQQEADEILAKRAVKYPPGIKCPGSFFKNIVAKTLPKEILEKIPPEKIVYGKLPAGALLDEVGAKGQNLDGIEIASYHANLFINKDSGTAKDFYELAKTYALKVKEKYGITLEPEVKLINLPSLI